MNDRLFPYLHGFKQRATGPDTIEYKIGESIYDDACGSTGFLCESYDFLKAGGRGGIVVKNTFLSNTDNALVSLRKLLLESCNLHTVLDCPGGTFQGASVKTVVLFFDKGEPTRKVWFYQLDPDRTMGKTNPLNDADLIDLIDRHKDFANSPKSWSVDVKGTSNPSSPSAERGGWRNPTPRQPLPAKARGAGGVEEVFAAPSLQRRVVKGTCEKE